MNNLNLRKEKFFKKNSQYFFKNIKFGIKYIVINILIILLILFYTNKSKRIIPIVLSINDNYAYPLIVLLTSILYNSSRNSFFIFYILTSPDLSKTKLDKILNLKEKYNNYKMILINMGEYFSKYNLGRFKTAAVYYRLALSNLIKDVDKIIYLDIDTIVHKDLYDLFSINMGKYYYMGFPGLDMIKIEFNGTRNFINSGVMLINLKKLREINSAKLYDDYYFKYGTKKEDEYLINAVFYDKISFLPLIYGIPDFGAGSHYTVTTSHFLESYNNLVNYTIYDIENASLNRVITHNCYETKKWWNRKYDNLTYIGKQWLFYASKTNIFEDICKTYKQFENECIKMKI